MTEIRFKTSLSGQREAAVKAVIEQLDGLSTSSPLKQQNNWVNESKTRKPPKKL
jgi:hypothetical protein